MPRLKTAREKRDSLHKKAIDLKTKLDAEDRGMTPEETGEFRSWMKETNDLDDEIKNLEEFETGMFAGQRNDRLREQEDRQRFEERRRSSTLPDPDEPVSELEKCEALSIWAAGKQYRGRKDADAICKRAGIDFRSGTIFIDFSRGFDVGGSRILAPRNAREIRYNLERRREARKAAIESRAYQKINLTTAGVKDADGSLGGYTVPDEMMGPLDQALLQWGGMRQSSTILSTSTGADLPIPMVNDTSQKGEIIAENIAVNEQEASFSQLVLGSYKYSSKMIRVSLELVNDSAINLPVYLGEALGTRLGRIQNDHFTTGTGTSQPRGIVTAAANSSITAGTAGALAYSEIMGLKHTVDPAYRTNGQFMMADATLKKMKLMADSQNRPLWLPSLLPGEPPTFDGDTYIVNQSMPSTAATKGLIYGDLSKYIIREVSGIELMRLDERYAEYYQTAFLAFMRCDGDLMNAGTDPVKYLTLA